ncbi:nitroreductase [Prolixibacteraceae bacterium JC049]|nr:nitroreductase [Prolixibacteraceae bacterium JC049]
MTLQEIIEKRYSVRSYLDKPVEEEKLLKVLNAGRLAPSAVNFQPWKFVVVKDSENKKAFESVYHRDWFNQAPVYIIICADHTQSWKRAADEKDHADIDAAIAIDHMTLMAIELGLGTCWVCNFYTDQCREKLNMPEHMEPVAILSLGYPANETTPNKKRKSLDDVVIWESF